MKSIEIIITETGEVQIEAVGFKGQACEKATAEMEKALGTVRSSKRKPDYYASTVAQQKVGGA